jgi:predicted DNA-binding protein
MAISIAGEAKMVNIVNRSRYFLDIDPELRNRVKAVAALEGKTMKKWLTEAIIEKLEDDIDAREGLASLGDVEGTVSLKNYISSQMRSRRV